ncbi:non-ribosomal peptide synthetase [Gordonia liuliyuniae]|uniref:Amino acid adenylation domain-containing protein n=1 Tax=Gordonia liuliyuniae TaxID=2911517 RepID=A0ABS9ISG1_9ACTN|nr:non-ribosomal peptide synthetase [Gordonia liuliyuniae]MCF8588493.1 amino acid adenylation domain-containing protein [Gordonia liuliyuniae]
MSTDNLIHSVQTRAQLPLTAAQRGIYYAQQIDPHVPMSVAAYVEFHGDVDADRLDRAVGDAVVETESGLLRLVWNGEDEPTAFVDDHRDVTLGRRDFSRYADPLRAAQQWMDEHRSHVPDLFTDPLLETYLLTLGPDHSIWYCWGHHLAFDGYAAMYMMLRVAQRYTAADGSPLPDADIASMADVADLDANYRGSAQFTADRDFWSNRLGHDMAALPNTSFSTRSDEAAPLATVVSTALDDAVVEKIRSRAAELGVRPASVIAAALTVYLARFNNTADAMLSLPVAARDTAALRTSAGLTSNVVPVLACVDDADRPRLVDELIREVNGDIKNAVRHQHFRHEDITSDVLSAAAGRRGFFGPMLNVMLFFKHIDFGPLTGALHIMSTGPVEDASVNVYDSISGGMHLDLEANPNVYDDAEVDAHHHRLVDFVARFVAADPQLPVTGIPVTTSDEIAIADRCAVGPTADYGDLTVTDLLADAYRSFADRPALIDPDGDRLTYDDVRRRVTTAAAGLQARGIGPEDVVGVMLPRSIDQHIALHAILAAGAVFVPLAPDEPGSRRDHILDIASPSLVIVDHDHDQPIAASTARLDDLATNDDGDSVVDSASVRVAPDNGAYLLFTSGSTGTPKGVLITHRALVNRLKWMQDKYALTPADRVLQKTPASFDVSVWEYFWPLSVGAAAVVAAPDGHRDPWYLRRVVELAEVSALHFVPSMLAVFTETLAADPETSVRTRTALASVRAVFTSGEALTPGVVGATAALTTAPIHNLYGPTEATIDVTHHDACDPTDPTVPIGRPVHNTSAYVLDRRLDPSPTGAIGELYLGGVQLARGYLGRPDLTADRFVADPHGGGRLYRTGDLVRRRPDGELDYVGRSDTQIKIRGQRVELGEIENALAALPGVRTAGAVARDDLLSERIVIGYVSGDGLDQRDLRDELSAHVPPHMIPTAVVVCDALPTTANGKLDRRALPDPDLGGHGRTAAADAPATDLERLVHRTVCAVLGVTETSMSAGFFELGGNSLAATRIAARLSTATGRRLGIRTVLDSADVAGIVDAVRAHGVPDELPDTADTSRHVTIDGPVPLSPAQHRLWLASRLDPESAAGYNMPFTVRFIGDLDADALVAACNDVVDRHEPLRTTVTDVDGVACQDIRPADGRLLDVERRDTVSADSLKAFAAEPFDLGVDLPIRARLIAHSDRDHTLAVVVHHLAADGWSFGPLADDLADAYRARRSGAAPAWPALPVTYRQAAADRLAWLDDPTSSAGAQIEHWTQTLADAPIGTELPYDRPPSRAAGRSGASVRTPIDADTRARILALADDHGTTPFMVVHAAVAALLRTVSGTDDILVGTPVSGRGDDELDPLIGMFVNTLALRTPVDKNASFADLLAVVRDRDLAAFDNADVPFDRLVTELNPARSSSGQPYFDVSVTLEDAAQVSLDITGLAATATRIDTATSKFDLEFTVTDRSGDGGGMELNLGYADELFDHATAAGLASRYVRLLQTVTADPGTSVGDACTLDPADRLDLVPAMGGGSRPVEHLTQLLHTAASAEPYRRAIVDEANRHRLTYRELDEASDRLARILIDEGAGPERYVAVSLPRGANWMVALWAVTKSGAAWVPVDPAYPRARTDFMLADSGAEIVVTDAASAPRLSTTDHRVVLVGSDDVRAHGRDEDRSPVTDADRIAPIHVDQPAYLIYTSGTTGRPKGVVVSHRGLADFAAEQVSRLALARTSRTLHLASPSFDASVLEVIMAVGSAACMHIAPAHIVGGSELSDLMADAAITHAFLTPSLLSTMSPDDLPALDTLVIGGEHPNAESVRRWSDGRRLINAYGPTEVTVVATMSPSIEPTDSVTIGRPIRGVSALVLDERLRPVAPGVVGELYLCGSHLARGYHGVRPLTSKRFVANPFGEPGDRMYRTGDLVRWSAAHALDFRGRVDHQTKVRGHRIELGEIDAALVADAAIRSAVTVVSGTDDAAHLVAYATAPAGSSLDESAIRGVRDRLADRLPRHMLPSTIIALDEIPVTPAGKIDTRALPAPESTGQAHQHSPLQSRAEHTVADAIARVIGISADRLGREDDFFELGGNSLLATQLATALEQHTRTRVPVRALFDNSTVTAISRLIGEADTSARPDDEHVRSPLVHDESDAPVAPGPAQQQLWFLNQLAGPDGGAAYNIAFALDLDGDLDVRALEGALRHTIARHEPLRTRYPAHDGRPTLDVMPDADITLSPAPVTDDEWEHHARALATQPFDLTVDRPLRAVLHRLPSGGGEPTRHRLTLVVHHIAADGASMAPFAGDIATAYADLHADRAPQQSPTSFTYRDYLRWQAAELAAESGAGATRLDDLTSWWRENLDGINHAAVLASDVNQPTATGRAGVVEVEFPDRLQSSAIGAVAGATEFMTVHAVLATLLHRMSADPSAHVETGVSDLVIGTPVAGRPDPGLADLVGMFVNSVPLRTRVDSAAPFTDLLAAVRDADLDAISHADMPFEKLVAALAPPRTGRHPLFGVALTVDAPSDDVAVRLADMTATAREIGTGGARFDLELRIRDGIARFTYDVGLYSRQRITDLAQRFAALAQQIADHPERRIGDFDVARPGDGPADPHVTAPEPRHLADLLDRAVRTWPDDLALDDGVRRLTYREAGRITDRWARTLSEYGVGSDDVVAAAIGRSADSVLAVWAITKAGAAVLPVDPRHPVDRVRHMLTDSGAVLGVTTPEVLATAPDDLPWLTIDELTADLPGARGRLRDRPTRRVDGCAYVIYTSGTTGVPKGTSVTHRGLAAFAATQTRRYGVDGDSRTLHFASPGFDASMLELLLAVDAGATMVIAPPSIYGGDELTEFLAEHRITHAFVTPAALAAAAPRELPDLRCLGVGGESFGRELVARWAPGRTFLNCYGPTETTVVVMMSSLSPDRPITIGEPVDGTRAVVLDARLRPVPPFAPGDLYLMGPGLARGYLNRPAQTCAAFVSAIDGSGDRMYRTGDLASTDLSGTLTFHGRNDRQVKVRGFRIELDEIDATLARHPNVGAAVTQVVGSGDAAHLVSYVTGLGDARVNEDELIAFSAQRLPRQMVPSTVVEIDTIPLTVNGKIDHAALPAPRRAERVPSRRPAPGAESVLAGLVADALGLPAGSVGAEDDFFALGGTSLQATTLVSRINAVHRGEPIRVRTIFDDPSIARLARLLDVGTPDTGTPAARPPGVATPEAVPDRPTRFPLAPMQKRIWSLHRSDPDSVDYAMPFVLRLHGSLDAAALRGALVDVVTRHAVLRTTYTDTDTGPVGVVSDDPEQVVGDIEVDSHSSGTERAGTERTGAVVTALLERPFDLTRDAPLRAALTGDGDSHALIIVLHHIAADGGSMPIVIGDLLDAYRARTGAADPQIAHAPAVPDYRDYASAHDTARESDDLRYWTSVLTGAPAATSVDADPAVADRTGGARVDLPIDDELRDEVTAFARSNATSPFTVLHTALAMLLNRLGTGDDLVIGTPVDTRAAVSGGRGDPDFRATVGMFVNTVALRTEIDRTASAQSLLERVRSQDLDAWDHLTAPFDDVVSAVNPPRVPGRGPLFQVALSVHDFTDSIAGEQMPVSADLVGEIAELDTHTAKFDLQFTVTGMNTQSPAPGLSLTYARNRYSRAGAEELGVRLLRVVRALVADPQRCVGDIRITDPLEVDRLAPVSGPAATTARTYADLLDDAVRRNPDGVAVSAEDADGSTVDVTYRDLSERANRLARRLLTQGVARRPESVVAVAIPRSLEAIVTIWAVVRTGAAYVPVDPTYPAERIAHMLDDSGADLIVTTAAHAAALPADGVLPLVLDDPDMRRRLAATPATPIDDDELPRPIDVDQLAYVIYTSGSTGTPKGVLVPHRGLAAVHDELADRMAPDTTSRVLHFASPSFDASVLEFLLAAAGAATLVVAPTSVYGGTDLQDFLARSGVSHAFITPAAVATMSADAVPSLTSLAVGGEAVAPDLVRAWSPGRTLLNVYGPTETTIITTGSAPLSPEARVTIGSPNNGVSAVVLDDRLHPVPAGVAGELYLLGPQITRGYHGRRALTSTRYPAAPMVLGPEFAGQRMYRTGDLVRWSREDRCLEYIGRTDGQVQVRGFRVELGEIDDALTAVSRVRAAVTIADTTSGLTVLHSYVTPEADAGPLDTAAVRRAVARRLPRHMVPSTVTALEHLPLTAVGKVDRRALTAPAARSDVGDAPVGETEQRVADAFAAVLGVDRVGRDDNFFDIGGDSLLATTLATRLREAGFALTVPDVFAAPTPVELAAAVTDLDDGDRSAPSTSAPSTSAPSTSTASTSTAVSPALAPLLTLRRGDPGTTKTPLFVVHPAIGLAWSFTTLLPHVDDGRPVYGLQSPALSGADAAESIDELAADYVRRIREVAPHGPYRLLGWSLGGLIAHEIGVALQQSGERVEQLVLLDSYVLADHADLPHESVSDLLSEFGIDAPALPDDSEIPDPSAMSAAVRASGGPLAELTPDDLDAVRATFEAAGPLARHWRPRVFTGDAVFVTATSSDTGIDPRADWTDRVTGTLTDVRADCTHARMLLPGNVAQFGYIVENRRPN